jgi:hypothetical protein
LKRVEHRLLPLHFLKAGFKQFHCAQSIVNRPMSDLHLERAIAASLGGCEELVVPMSQIGMRASEVGFQAR